jgi:hypothetical protein
LRRGWRGLRRSRRGRGWSWSISVGICRRSWRCRRAGRYSPKGCSPSPGINHVLLESYQDPRQSVGWPHTTQIIQLPITPQQAQTTTRLRNHKIASRRILDRPNSQGHPQGTVVSAEQVPGEVGREGSWSREEVGASQAETSVVAE